MTLKGPRESFPLIWFRIRSCETFLTCRARMCFPVQQCWVVVISAPRSPANILRHLTNGEDVRQCRKWINWPLLRVIYRQGFKGIIAFFPPSWTKTLNYWEWLGAGSVLQHSSQAPFVYVKASTHSVLFTGGAHFRSPPPDRPSPAQCDYALQHSDWLGKAIQPLHQVPMCWKHTFPLTEEVFLWSPCEVIKWCLCAALLALNKPHR